MGEIFDYLLAARPGWREAEARDGTSSPVAAAPAPAERRDAGGPGTPDLLDLLLERLDDETVRRAIVRLIVPH